MNEKPNNVINLAEKRKESQWKVFLETLNATEGTERMFRFKRPIFVENFAYESETNSKKSNEKITGIRKIRTNFQEAVFLHRDRVRNSFVFLGYPLHDMSGNKELCRFWVSEEELKSKIFDEKGSLTVEFERV